MITLSPSLVQGSFELLEIAARNSVTFPQIKSSFGFLSNMPIDKVLATAQTLNWIHSDDNGIAVITPRGNQLLSLKGYEPMVRQAILDYVEIIKPPWLQNAVYGRTKVLAFSGNGISQLFVEAGLVHGFSDSVIDFWDNLASIARGQKNDRLIEIGRIGEKLTLEYEESRTGKKAKWISIESNEDGYDVLSTVDTHDDRKLSIEVKTTQQGYFGCFYITANEWDRAESMENHAFYLWNISSQKRLFLAKVTRTELSHHIPHNIGVGEWKTAEIPFSIFQNKFTEFSHDRI